VPITVGDTVGEARKWTPKADSGGGVFEEGAASPLPTR